MVNKMQVVMSIDEYANIVRIVERMITKIKDNKRSSSEIVNSLDIGLKSLINKLTKDDVNKK